MYLCLKRDRIRYTYTKLEKSVPGHRLKAIVYIWRCNCGLSKSQIADIQKNWQLRRQWLQYNHSKHVDSYKNAPTCPEPLAHALSK